MRKISKVLVVMTIVCSMLFSSCGTVVDGVDKNKTQIYISVYDGGVGVEWIRNLSSEWNQNNEKYQVMISPEKTSTPDIINHIKSGATGGTNPSAYFTAEIGYQEIIYNDMLEDLSDMLLTEVDGAGNGTLKDKIGRQPDYYDSVWKNVATKHGQGMYMLPYCDNFGGLIFDYETFLEYGWLIKAAASDETALIEQDVEFTKSGSDYIFDSYSGNYPFFNYKKGDLILSAGKDGVFGSYDDGQPVSLSQWEDLIIDKITQAPTSLSNRPKAFMWTGTYSGYVDMILEAIMAQEAGLDAFKTYFSFDGKVVIDGLEQTVTPDNGYMVYGMDAFGDALNFIDAYFNNSNYYSPHCKKSTSHTDAQSYYVLGYRDEVSNPLTAMLVDGVWFENEAEAIFNTSSVIRDGYGYGDREYRFMLLPNLTQNAKGLDGNGNGSVFSVLNSGGIIVPKTSNKDMLAALKDFIAFTLKHENLVRFTMETGVINAYDYTLSSTELSSLTSFGRNIYAMYSDTANIGFARGSLLFNSSPMKFATSGGFFPGKFLLQHNGTEYENSIKAFDRAGITSANLIQGAKSYYRIADMTESGFSRQSWNNLLAQARTMNFYK